MTDNEEETIIISTTSPQEKKTEIKISKRFLAPHNKKNLKLHTKAKFCVEKSEKRKK